MGFRCREERLVRIFRPAQSPLWLENVLRSIEQAMARRLDAPIMLQDFAKADLPSAANWRGGMVYVTDDVGGAIPAYSDGTDWRRVSDRAIVS